MSFLKRPQLLALIAAALVIVLLLLLPRTTEVQREEETVTEEVAIDYTSQALNELTEDEKMVLNDLRQKAEDQEDPLEKINILDSISKFWEERERLIMAADALFEIAEILNDKPGYFIAGDKYYKAFSEFNDDRKKIALEKAMISYGKVLKILPDDAEAKTSLAVCYVEGAALIGEAPMKGIGLLKEVLEDDPENINALINLGYFAGKSGQFEKAIERFERVLEIDSAYTDAYLYLSDTYIQMGENEKAQ